MPPGRRPCPSIDIRAQPRSLSDRLLQCSTSSWTPLYYAISFILILFHSLWTWLGLDPAGGAAWALSIIGLTLVIRAALIPLFVKQIKSSRNMQLIQPKVKELQKKYGHDREKLAQETMKLYKDSGTNPFASCLPILLQMPIFFALFGMLNNAVGRQAQGRPDRPRPTEDFGAGGAVRCPAVRLALQRRRRRRHHRDGRAAGGGA